MKINGFTNEIKLDPGDFEFKKPINPFITFRFIGETSCILLKLKEKYYLHFLKYHRDVNEIIIDNIIYKVSKSILFNNEFIKEYELKLYLEK